jgi:gamma-glutamylcyclotransferase (GGCT)/AIG2-like uncharacterized protein YtfP
MGMPGAGLFVYGTLMDEERVFAITGRRFPGRAARLEGYERITSDRGYPYVIPAPGSHVEGLLLEGIDAAALRALDRYEDEGRLYLRRPVDVIVGDARVACETYVGAGIRAARAPARRPRRTSGA